MPKDVARSVESAEFTSPAAAAPTADENRAWLPILGTTFYALVIFPIALVLNILVSIVASARLGRPKLIWRFGQRTP